MISADNCFYKVTNITGLKIVDILCRKYFATNSLEFSNFRHEILVRNVCNPPKWTPYT